MSYFFCPVPGAQSFDLTSVDGMFRGLTSGLFGTWPPNALPTNPNGGLLSNLLVRRGHQPGGICARSGNYFPGEQLTTDGQGRQVGKRFRTDGPAVIPDTPFPVFYKSPPSVEGEH